MQITEMDIAKAIKLTISQLGHDPDPVVYLYNVNQVLNRYKSNLYKLMDVGSTDLDINELVQITITTGARIDGTQHPPQLLETSPVLLKVYGQRAIGLHGTVLADGYSATLDITEVFDIEAMTQLRTSYSFRGRCASRVDEEQAIKNHPEVDPDKASIGVAAVLLSDRRWNLSMTIAGLVYRNVAERVLQRHVVDLAGGNGREQAGRLPKPRSEYKELDNGVQVTVPDTWHLLDPTVSGYHSPYQRSGSKVGMTTRVWDASMEVIPNSQFTHMCCYTLKSSTMTIGMDKKLITFQFLTTSGVRKECIKLRTSVSKPVPDQFESFSAMIRFIKHYVFTNLKKLFSYTDHRRKFVLHAFDEIDDPEVNRYQQGDGMGIVKEDDQLMLMAGTTVLQKVKHMEQISKFIMYPEYKIKYN